MLTITKVSLNFCVLHCDTSRDSIESILQILKFLAITNGLL